jgi:hypothetical protein
MEAITDSFSTLVFLFLVSVVAVLIVHQTFKRLRTAASNPLPLEVRIEELGGFGYRQLVLISLLTLFLEMMMIRWVSSEVRIFAYFKNFVLVACFLGFGLGCYLCRRRIQLLAMIAPLLLLTLILKTPISPLRRTMSALPQLLGGGVEVHVWGVPAMPPSWTGMLLAMAVVVPLFAVIATTFIPFGQLVGWYLENAPNGVAAYSVMCSQASLESLGLLSCPSFISRLGCGFWSPGFFLCWSSGTIQERAKLSALPSWPVWPCSRLRITAMPKPIGLPIRNW